MSVTKTYACGGINWCWYLTLKHYGDGRVDIIKYERYHRERHAHKMPDSEKGIGGDVREDGDRIVRNVWLYNGLDGVKEVYRVCNPKHVFDY